MSNYGSMPPPGAYTPPSQGAPHPQQQQGQQLGAPSQGQPGHPHKPGGTFGQMMNQAVTTGKPMLNKLQKTISSKLGGKPASGTPQHLQSYQNYQQHQGQGQAQGQGQGQSQSHGQIQGQTQGQGQGQGQGQQSQPLGFQQQQQGQMYSPQSQQQQWQQPQQPPPPQAPNTYSAQQSPFQQSTYGTPASAYSGQSNYFPPQASQPSHAPPSSTQPHNTTGYDLPAFNPGLATGPNQQPQIQQGQYGYQGQTEGQTQGQTQGHIPGQTQGQHQAQFRPDQQLQGGQYPGQQTGVVGGAASPGYVQSTHATHMGDVSPEIPPNKPAMQTQWSYPSGSEPLPPPGLQQPPQGPVPAQQQYQNSMTPQQQPQNVFAPQPSQATPSTSLPHDQQQWGATSPMSSVPPPPVSPPLPQMHAQPPPSVPSGPSPPTQPPTPASQHAATKPPPTEFVAELPADLGNLSLVDSKPHGVSGYQAYQPPNAQAGSPSNRFSVPRRAVSTSSLPLADPWRFADPITEQPTREFYIVADLLFDALDRKFEPQNTGLLEAPKILKSWTELTEDAHRLFSYNSYTALARMWSLEGVPHIMVPVQPSLTPVWNFNQHSHAQDLKVIVEQPSTYATYMPALNRAGWYKFFFLEAMHGPDDMCKLLPALCTDSYRPGVLNHPDLNRRDRSSIPALQARAAAIQSHAIQRVCEEAKAAMVHDPSL